MEVFYLIKFKETLGNKIITQIKTINLNFELLVESFQSYTVKLHLFFKDDLNLSYPIDILVFITIGFLISYIKLSLTSKNKFVYNHPDQPDYSGLITTVSNYIIHRLEIKRNNQHTKIWKTTSC